MGHRITDNRHDSSAEAGYDCFHVAIDDATWLAYIEVLPDETRRSTTAFLVRALRWFRARGIRVERVMTDNGSGYVSRLFRKVLRMLGIQHIRTRPYTPKTIGKAERFIQTLLREWAYTIPFSSSEARVADLPRWLTWYNQQRPHGSLGRRTPAQSLAGTTRSELTAQSGRAPRSGRGYRRFDSYHSDYSFSDNGRRRQAHPDSVTPGRIAA